MPRFESGSWFFEIELDGCDVTTCTGSAAKKKTRTVTHATEDLARWAYGTALARQRWLKLVGPSRHIPTKQVVEPAGSALLVDEMFAAGNDAFLGELLRAHAPQKLAALAPRWFADKRPWARRMLLAYIDDGCDRAHHKALVKRLFKAAEAAGDDELMAHFMVAFDTLVRRILVKRYPRRAGSELALRGDPTIPFRAAAAPAPERGRAPATPANQFPNFSRKTRQYLARRAYRYFRRIAHGDIVRYGRAVRVALPLYRDEQLATPARLLDAWGLMHALYGWSKQIVRTPRGIRLAGTLEALAPAPHFPTGWYGAFDELIAMLAAARSRTVRAWTIAWLRANYTDELATLAFPSVKSLITSPHEEVQLFGAQLLPATPGLDALPITAWLELLAVENLEVVPVICEVVEQRVSPARLELAQCIELACAKTAPVARLGLAWARTKRVETAADLTLVTRLAKAGVAVVRSEGTAWVMAIIATHEAATRDHVRDLCDAPHADTRAAALASLDRLPRLVEPALWYQLTESPYDDVRATVVKHAAAWRSEAPKGTLVHVWSGALLAVHRGSRSKRFVPRQIADRIASHPAEARELLPLLGHALRSVRAPERAAAIAAIARAVHANPELRALTSELLPELVVTDQVTS